jgi:outer membrane protein
MKYSWIVLFLVFVGLQTGYSQLRIGYVDSDAIMEQLPDAQDARAQLDQLIQEWQTELNEMEQEWQKKYDDYEKRKLIMSNRLRTELEAELVEMENEIIQFREKKFGTNGELFQKQAELMEPVQNKVFLVIEQVALEEEFDYILDRSGGVLILFAKEEYDITNLVLEKLELE